MASACISMGRLLCPSTMNVTHVPAGVSSESLTNRLLGSETSSIPSPLISKQPTSSVGPKRFFRLRRRRSAVWLSPSNWHTTSTRCSRVRGPAIEPSLVTCPTRSMGISSVFAHSITEAATSRTWVFPPRMPSVSALDIVWTESTIASAGFSCSMRAITVPRSVVEARRRLPTTVPMRRARMRICPRDSSPEI